MKDSTAYIAAGSNSGDRQGFINEALLLLKRRGVQLRAVSSMYETEPQGFYSPVWFLNCAFCLSTSLSPYALMDLLLETEHQLGRRRNGTGYSSRPIDLDLLFYDNRIIISKKLTLPHPRIAERPFVLEPLNEIAPNFTHPLLNKTVNELLISLKPACDSSYTIL